MPTLTVTMPSSLEAVLKDAVVGCSSSLDSLVTGALSQYFQTAQHRAYQISTSAALVQGAHGGAVTALHPLISYDNASKIAHFALDSDLALKS